MLVKINTLADIFRINDDVDVAFKKHLVEYFGELRDSLAPDDRIDTFTLEAFGPIVIVDHADDYDMLGEIGIADILETEPEWVELKEEGFYQAGILCNNEYMLILYLKEDTITEAVQDWIDCNV